MFSLINEKNGYRHRALKDVTQLTRFCKFNQTAIIFNLLHICKGKFSTY